MKCTRKILSFLLAALMIVPLCVSLTAYAEIKFAFTELTDKAFEVTDGVTYRKFNITSGVGVDRDNKPITSNGPHAAHILEFDTDDYMFIPYTGTAGGSATLEKHYKYATEAGYDVVGIINGSFFSTDPSTANGNYGYMNDYIVSNGVIYSADFAAKRDMLCVDKDGNLVTVEKTQLRYDLYLNGQKSAATIGYINKSGGFKSAANWGDQVYYYDCHSGNNMTGYRSDPVMESKALTYACCPGYEILCRKKNGTELTIGGTLEAEVIEVKTVSYGTEIGPDEFVLFLRHDSTYAGAFQDLKAGDTVSIMTSECIPESAAITSNAVSITSNIGYLVKDGVNVCSTAAFNQKYASIAHTNIERARWTAIGVKADGSYVFFTNEGESTGNVNNITLQDVAEAMIRLGCVDVVRFDGGGSCAMYLCNTGSGKDGFMLNHGRPISDCLMVVRRSSPALQVGTDAKETLNALIAEAEKATANDNLTAALNRAKAVAGDARSVSGDYLLATANLRYALSGKSELGELMSAVSQISFKDYSEYVLDNLRAAYNTATIVFGSAGQTAEQIKTAYNELEKWYKLKGDVTIDGKEYKVVSDGIYLTGMNMKIYTDYSCIYTPGTYLGTPDDISAGVNLNWSQVLLVRKNSMGDYILEQNFFGGGSPKAIFNKLGFQTVPEDCLVLGVHGDDGAGYANKTIAASAQIGMQLVLHGIDLETKSSGVGSYFSFKRGYVIGDVSGNNKLDSNDYLLVKRYVLKTLKVELSAAQLAAADVTHDGRINASDYYLIKRAILSKKPIA